MMQIDEVTGGRLPGGQAASPLGGQPLAFSEGIAVRGHGGLLFVSGQIAVGDDGGIVGQGDIPRQVAAAFDNFERVVRDAGATMGDVVKLTCFVAGRDVVPDYTAEKYRRFPAPPFPASSTVVATLLHPGALLELEGVVALQNPEP